MGSTKYVSLDPGSSDTTTILWIPSAAKNYSVMGEVVGSEAGKVKGIYSIYSIYSIPPIK